VEEFAKNVKGNTFGEATNVLTMLEALREEIEARAPGSARLVGHAYGKLSDICHPAFGGYGVLGLYDGESIELSRTAASVHAIVVGSEILPTLVLSGAVSLDRLRRLGAFAEWGTAPETYA